MKLLRLVPFAVVVGVAAFFSSCTPDTPMPIPNDKLLLSEYHQQLDYVDQGYSDVYDRTYSYGPRQGNLFFSVKPMLTISLPDNGGSYNFTFDQNRPDKLIDNSSPGYDQGYWKFYTDNFGRINKVGIAYQLASEPTTYDYYDYDALGHVEYAYRGVDKAVPDIYIHYLYGSSHKLTGYDYYGKVHTPAPKNTAAASAALPGYGLFVHADIASDNRHNPLSQQGSILFYPSDNGKSPFRGDISNCYISLMDNNPTQVNYFFNEALFGAGAVMQQTFSYVYNGKGYPVSCSETITDPLFTLDGNINRTSQFSYIPN